MLQMLLKRLQKLFGDEKILTTTRLRNIPSEDNEDSFHLRKDWAKAAIQAGGNYGEIFSRNVGTDSTLDLTRGLNAQWNARPAGLIYALPIR